MSDATGYRLKNPPHPGGFVRTEIIHPAGNAAVGVENLPTHVADVPPRTCSL